MKLNIVPARQGVQWVRLGMQTFMKQPLALAALVFMYSMIALAMLIVPVIGPLLAMAIVPAGTLGLMAATKAAQASEFPTPQILLSGFRASRERVRAMIVLGVLYAACIVIISVIVHAIVEVPDVAGKDAMQVAESPEFVRAFLLSTFWSSVLYLPVSVAFWHAPALVHWHGIPPVKSLFFSFVACVRNAGAFTVYGLVWVGIVFATAMVATVVGQLTPWLSGVVLGACGTVIGIVFYISIWFTFRDSFLDAEGNPGDSQ